MARPEQRWFCLDCEASGPIPGHYNLLSIGVVAVEPDGQGGLRPGARFYVELMPVYPGVDPEAVAVCGLDVERLKREGVAPGVALQQLTDWIRAHTPEGARAVFVGHNAVFDWLMVRWYYGAFGIENPFGYKALDTKALAMGVLGLSWPDSNKETLERLLDLPAPEPDQVHRADYDAWYQALILIRLLERMPPEARA